jgi:hypothetical protein
MPAVLMMISNVVAIPEELDPFGKNGLLSVKKRENLN